MAWSISINTSELIFDMESKSHTEVSSITDIDKKYIAEASVDKEDELKRDLLAAKAELEGMIIRFLTDTGHSTQIINYANPILPESFVFEFIGTPRRCVGKSEIIRDSIFSILVDLALSRFYLSVDCPDLSRARRAEADYDMKYLSEMIYTKKEPSFTYLEDNTE